MKVTMTSSLSSSMSSSSYPPPLSASATANASSILLNTGQAFDPSKDKATIVNGKQLLANKPLNVTGIGLGGGGGGNVASVVAGTSQHSIASSAMAQAAAAAAASGNNNGSSSGGGSGRGSTSKNTKTTASEKHKHHNKYASDDLSEAGRGRDGGCCRCMGPKTSAFWIGLLTNLGICTLLLAYTLLGSFLFMTIEGGAMDTHTILASTTSRQLHSGYGSSSSSEDMDYVKYQNENSQQQQQQQQQHRSLENITFSPAAMLAATEDRHKTVENIWDITVSLNILYRDNWTRLAELEIAKFQDQVIKRLREDMVSQLDERGTTTGPVTGAIILHHEPPPNEIEWTLPKAFLYSLTVLTTIGYGCMTPRTTLGRMATLAYAVLGIPLTLIYLSSTGSVLSRVARGVFSRALCCCLCSNCGYCCYDEKRMAEKERRMRKKRQLEEQQRAREQHILLKEPYYVRPGSASGGGGLHSSASTEQQQNNLHSPEKGTGMMGSSSFGADIDSISTCTESKTSSMHGLSLLAPILLCIAMMVCYITFGALALFHLEDFPLLDGVFFCFMSLSTIGFGELGQLLHGDASDVTIWFCSAYIMSGMALTAMCFDVLHSEIVYRIKSVVTEIKRGSVINLGNASGANGDSHNDYAMPP